MVPKNVDQHGYEKAGARFWIRLIFMYLLMPVVLLTMGWDLGWWQGWLYSVLFVGIGIGSRVLAEKRHPGLMVERSKFGKDQNAKPWDKVLAPLMAFSLSFPLFIVAGLDHHFGWSPEFPIWLNILGFILIIPGFAFASWAIIENRFFSSVTRIQKERGHVVCDSGPYRIVRHPGYAGNIPPLAGVVLALGSVWTIIPAIIALIIAVIRTTLEDKTLQEELPGYRDYARRVRYRLIPGIF
ncbi:isoprenylcysteine carboxylmethyltransferase family protein [Lutimonas halocynthiae]|uniref:methyltransferase family protein n=1 Tax=Lutimonas halocynthiae TaxID=1446477 RepID=UPI0025B39A57|nr:isoprenylcysteine carboxylmethyltransferase family protein [Lutimonas halocynthiae]MDN3643201.1 isoprenylcysteine carboxylmethyltransferase family protein [Lutimonas halocynthiae]